MRKFLLFLVFILMAFRVSAQMNINGQLLYGNEWIDFSKEYLKITVDEDGIYKISYQDLLDNGFPIDQISGSDIQLIHFGQQISIHTSSEGSWNATDYLLFYGIKNNGELDKHLYKDWEQEQLNPFYSLFTDKSNYFLTWEEGSTGNNRFEILSNDLNSSLPPQTEFYIHKERQVFSSKAWSPTAPEEPDAEYSNFIVTEGFGNKVGPSHLIEFPVTDIYIYTGIKPHLRVRTGSNNQYNHIISVSFNDQLLEVDPYAGNQIKNYEYELKLLDLKSTSLVELEGNNVADNIIVAYAELDYPRLTKANGKSEFPLSFDIRNTDRYFEIEDFDGGSENLLFDITNNKIIPTLFTNGVAKFRYPAGIGSDRILLVNNDKSIKVPSSIEMKSFDNIDGLNPEFLIISSKVFNNTVDLGGLNPLEEYANYRSSEAGGGYETSIVEVETLFDQFGYGIEDHSIALKNFAMYVNDKWPDFKMAFFIGKGLSYINRNKNTVVESFVPSFGKPGSDNLIFSKDSFSYPYVGVGRLAAHNSQNIIDYLEKAKQHDKIFDVSGRTIEERKWLKNVLHLSGGDIRIQDAIFNHLQEMKNSIESSKFAGNVTTFKKTSTDPVQTSLSQEIINLINDGTSIITFFGHSSAGTFDFSIEDPSKWDNTGRYPIVFSLGCHSGDIHETVYSLSEDFILTKDRGSIAFIASSGNAFIPQLASYAKGMYSDLGEDFYGEPVGIVIQRILEDQYNPANARSVTLHQQNTLHGDPAVRLYMAEGPDYVVDFPSISTMGDVGTLSEKINLSFDIINLGSGVQDSMSNILIHEYGDDYKDTIYFRTAAPFNRETINLKMPNPGTVALGKNVINIVLDYKNEIAERPDPTGEDNNELKVAYNNEGYCFFVFDNSAFPVFPPEFGIVYQQGVTLSASASNAFASREIFVMELDTTEGFDSPFLQKAEIESSPSLIQWTPGITLENNRVYYWRISPKENNSQFNWNTSSFIFLENGSDGWNQSHLYQWQKDNFNNFTYDENYRQFLFAEDLKEIRVKNGSFRLTRPSISYQNQKSEYIEFDEHINQGVYISSFDGVTGLPMTNEIPSLYGSYFSSPWAENWMNFPYNTHNKDERAKAINFIENVIPDGNFVVVYTIQRSDINTQYRPEDWASDGANGDPDLMSIFEKHGANRVRDLESGARPYIFVFKKNDNAFVPIEVVADNASEEIEAEFKILGRWFEGSVYTTTIGPAQEWERLLWEIDQYESDEDTFRLDVIGIRTDEVEDTLFNNIKTFDLDLSVISADSYPYLKLNFYAADEISRTSPQIKFWRVMYKEKPEAVLNINERFVFKADTLYLGNDLSLKTKATNISHTDMDSLLVKYFIVDDTNSEVSVTERLAPLPAQQSIDIDFTYPTINLLGLNQFRVEINPEMEQPEQFDFNNVGVINFYVQGDLINPLLDVTFDGLRIMDGEIISPVPLISVTLKDENEFLYIDDISSFDLAIQKLPDTQSVPIDLSSSAITFYPADSTNNNLAKLEYEAEFETGEYILYVQAKDASGNLSGNQKIEIRFKVVAESMVTNVLNYPNPFSTSTEFVFTLTGHVVPDIFTIQIMTLSGKVVREITREELGSLRIGINRSDYKWDGTDAYGNRLANGVYLYKVYTSSLGETFDTLNNEVTDSFFKHGFGKLVIMR